MDPTDHGARRILEFVTVDHQRRGAAGSTSRYHGLDAYRSGTRTLVARANRHRSGINTRHTDHVRPIQSRPRRRGMRDLGGRAMGRSEVLSIITRAPGHTVHDSSTGESVALKPAVEETRVLLVAENGEAGGIGRYCVDLAGVIGPLGEAQVVCLCPAPCGGRCWLAQECERRSLALHTVAMPSRAWAHGLRGLLHVWRSSGRPLDPREWAKGQFRRVRGPARRAWLPLRDDRSWCPRPP